MIWRGLAIGVVISAPMGPVGILCVQRTLEKGRKTGFFTGVGASISDLLYCLLTGFGLSFIEGFLKANQTVIQIFGSIVLILFGIYLFRSHPARKLKKPEAEKSSIGKNVLGGFLFTVSNPLIIFLIIGLFARFDFFLPEISFGLYVLGYVFIIIGALTWWWIVSYFVDKLRAHFNLRSMWLINKITGGIIMIFAVVGIVTAFSNVSNADTRTPVYMNSTRGFGTLGNETDEEGRLVISNESSDTIVRFIKTDNAKNFIFSFRAANLNNATGKKYKFNDFQGKSHYVKNPSWGIIFKDNDRTSKILISASNFQNEDLSPITLDFSFFNSDGIIKTSLSKNIDPFLGFNSISLRKDDKGLSLFAGNRSFAPVFENIKCCFNPEYIGFFICPGASLCIDNISLRYIGETVDRNNKFIHLGNEDARVSYFNHSKDLLEGEWEIFDRMLEEDMLKSGGNYRLALVKTDEGYEVLYIDGAVKNPHVWEAGMTKAFLYQTSFKNVFNVIWLDPSGNPVNGEIVAQFTAPDIISFQFPDHGTSTMRLRKIR